MAASAVIQKVFWRYSVIIRILEAQIQRNLPGPQVTTLTGSSLPDFGIILQIGS
jgi:hypothetical protein